MTARSLSTLALFCHVVDNYGDVGICWRLARQLVHEHGIAVTLWLDHLPTLKRLHPAVQLDLDIQQHDGVTVRHWRDQEGAFAPAEVADIVIEFFACDIPPGYIAAMAQCEPRPVWFNLEGLTAEEWVEGCHTLPSPHPRLSLTKHFFFPGFTARTGGLMKEAALEAQRRQFQGDAAAVQDFLGGLGLRVDDAADEKAATLVSLFCYPYAPVADLLAAWQHNPTAITCLVPEGVAVDAVEAFLAGPAVAGAVGTHGALTLRVLPFLPQPDYDKLLWSCDLNFVRGEDSFVRAQWAGRPFVWHIYAQDENLHHKKLRAFLQRYAASMPALTGFSLAWNGAQDGAVDWPALWSQFAAEMPALTAKSTEWEREMREIGEFTANMLTFAHALTRETDQEDGIISG
jgi:uncharacterized repeat protein (TIGR03837 family)